MSVPAGVVTMIVPVGVVHVGCTVTLPVGVMGAVGSVKVLVVLSEPVQPTLVMLKSLYKPCGRPLKRKPLAETVMLAVCAVVPFL